MRATLEVESTSCSESGFCGWLGYGVERHASLSCLSDEAFLIGVIPFHEEAGRDRYEWTFRPFFPREERICIYLDNEAGTRVIAEQLVSLPGGYGRQASSSYNCADFAFQRRAQYYLELYPSDPSGLDADNDGHACEANDCPCGAEPIPAEPAPPVPPLAPPPPPYVPPEPEPLSPECEAAIRAKHEANRLVRKAEWRYERDHRWHARAARYWRKRLRKAERDLSRAEQQIDNACPWRPKAVHR
jgi:Excalibur calcium-binding domain